MRNAPSGCPADPATPADGRTNWRNVHVHDQCDRCGSREVLQVPCTPGDHSHIVTGDRLLRNVTTDTYVCTDCGRVEQWVNNKSELALLKKAWALRQAGAEQPATDQ